MAIPTLNEIVAVMQVQIIIDVMQGRVPVQVRSFGDLHDYVDANEYGNLCDDEFSDELIAHFGGRDEHEGMPQGMLDYINAAQSEIDKWLKEGGMSYRVDGTSWEDFSPYHYGALLIKFKAALRALDKIQSSTYASAETLRLIAHKAYMEVRDE